MNPLKTIQAAAAVRSSLSSISKRALYLRAGAYAAVAVGTYLLHDEAFRRAVNPLVLTAIAAGVELVNALRAFGDQSGTRAKVGEAEDAATAAAADPAPQLGAYAPLGDQAASDEQGDDRPGT